MFVIKYAYTTYTTKIIFGKYECEYRMNIDTCYSYFKKEEKVE
jgi:hypothetical protein